MREWGMLHLDHSRELIYERGMDLPSKIVAFTPNQGDGLEMTSIMKSHMHFNCMPFHVTFPTLELVILYLLSKC